MAQATTGRWTKLSLWVGDGADPEDFTKNVCGMKTKSFRITATTSDAEVPDCDDPDLAVWIERVIRSLSSQFSGAGVHASENAAFFRDWMLSGQPKNVRIVVENGAAGYFAGPYLMTQYEVTGNLDDGKLGTSIELQSSGAIAWQAGAP